MKNLLIIDGNSILNRAFYGIRPLTAPDGTPTNAIYGFVNILKKHIDALKPDYMACAFDLRHPTFRHEKYDGYKANRKPMPEDLAAQLPIAKEMAKALGFKVLECKGFEADDIIGTVCAMGDEAGDIRSYALTGDRDSLQLITDKTSVILAKTKEDIVFTPDTFYSEFGVTPTEYIDVKALMGDSSDNIPGVRGIGEKSAFKLIADCHSLDGLYEKIEELPLGKSTKEKLVSGKEDAYSSKFLVTIVKNAPVCSLEELKTEGYNQTELKKLFGRLDFKGMEKRFDFSTAEETPSLEVPPCLEINAIEAMTMENMAVYPHGEDMYLCNAEGVYVVKGAPLDIYNGRKIICHDYKTLKKKISAECAFDTMLAAYLISPGEGSYPLDKVVRRYVGEAPEDGASTVYAVWKLYEILSEKLREEGMEKLLHEIEIPLAGVLSDMEQLGMMIDKEGICAYSEELKKVRDATADAVFASVGHTFNLNSPKQLATVLFDELHLPVQKKTKSGASTDAEVLKALVPYHEVAGLIIQHREISKLISTYTEVLPTLADEEGRVHTTFNQTGTATGRLSSSDPNLQNIPVRGQLGREIRRYFVAKEGYTLIDADYSQIELRVLAEISGDKAMQEAFISGEDIHTTTAAAVFGVSPLMVDSELRRRAKAVNFGIVYGIGAFSLSKDLGITRKTASDYIESYLATYPAVDLYLKSTVENATEKGYTVTAFGRKRPIPELASSNRNVKAFGERVAMNSPIQGTAADIIKIAMINTAKALDKSDLDAKLVMQVHDELIIEAKKSDADAALALLKEQMESVMKTSTPIIAEGAIADNWYDAK